jgi:hypothetical protein
MIRLFICTYKAETFYVNFVREGGYKDPKLIPYTLDNAPVTIPTYDS